MALEKWIDIGLKIASIAIIPLILWGISVETRYWQDAGDRTVIKQSVKHTNEKLVARIKVLEDQLAERKSLGKQLADNRVMLERLKGKINGNKILLTQIQGLLAVMSRRKSGN